MASTYSSNLKIELMATGSDSGTWGTNTNTNLGTAIEQAIIGYGNPDYTSDANLTITITNSSASQAARCLVLNVTSVFGSLTATRELIVPTIQKQYIVQNNTTGGQSITVKTSAGTGITVPNGRKAHLYVDGTNVIQMFDFVDINGGAIDGTAIGATSASTGAFTSLTASGATTLDGTVALGNASGDLITVPGTVNSNLIFTDNLFDIGASGATRPRNLFLAGAATVGGNLSVGGTLTLTGGVNLNGNVTVGDASTDTLTINSTITSNLIFTDNTFDIGASGATRPRNLFLAGNATIGGAQTLTGALTVDSTTDSTSITTGSIQTDGGLGVAKALFVGTTTNMAGALTYGGVTLNNAVTGTGNMVLSTSPTLVTPTLGVATATSLQGIIGNVTPAAGAFTSLTASTTLGVTGLSTLTAGALIEGLTVGRGAGAVADNTAVGASALAANTTGSLNTAVGQLSLLLNQGGGNNSAFGRASLALNTSGSGNSALGEGALYSNSSGTNNAGIGASALYNNTTASNNTAVGYQAGFSNTTGSVVAIGNLALYSNSTGTRNVTVGNNSLYYNTTGSKNVSSGFYALNSNTTGSNNVAIGDDALGFNTTASDNTAVGYQAAYSNTTGTSINAFGTGALYANTTGANNAGFAAGSLVSNTTGSQSTALGRDALRNNTTASNNTAVGFQALYTNVTGTRVTAVGSFAGYSSTANDNTFIGLSSGYSNTSGVHNIFVGAYDAAGFPTGYANTTGSYNTAMGAGALRSNTTASYNTAFGYQALNSNTTGQYNTTIGHVAGRLNTTGAITAVGGYALELNTTGTRNVAVGGNDGAGIDAALYRNTTGSSNTAMGYGALQANTTASNNTAVGYQALYSNTNQTNNTAIGYQAGYSGTSGAAGATYVGYQAGYNITGTSNTMVGASAGSLITSGTKNTILGQYNGNQDGLDSRTVSNRIVLSDGDGYPAFWGQSGSNGYMRLNAGRLEFPPTANPSSDANTLDDYEEGTWTPVIVGGTTAGTGTYASQVGRYTKIGNTVRIYFAVTWSAHTGTGTTIVTGFPFSSNATGQTPFAVFTYGETFTANNVANGGIMSNGATQWEHYQVPVGGGNSSGIPIYNGSAEIQVSGVYQTA